MVRVMVCFAVIALSACTSHRVSVQQVKARVSCNMGCEERFQQCSQMCDNNCHTCSKSARIKTARHYQQMVREQVIQGGMISRELNSYRDPLQCRKTTCNCQADLTVCLAACTGIIRKRLQVGPACC